MAYLFKRFSDFLGISDPEYVRAPPLDGEIIFCKNNVCVHPPSVLSNSVAHHPGYLTIRAQRVSERQTSLVLTWIPNKSLSQRKTSSCSTSSPARVTYVDIRKQIATKNDRHADNVSGDSLSILSKEDEAGGGENACMERSKETGRNESPQGSIQSFQDSGIGEGERPKVGKDQGVEGATGSEQCDRNEMDNKTIEGNLKEELSSESDKDATEQRLATLLNSPGGNKSPIGRPINLELQTKMKVHPPKDDDDKDSVSSSDSDDSETFNNILERLSNDVLPRQVSRRSSSTTPTTSNQDPSSLPSTPSPDESFDPFVPLYSLHSSSTCSPDIHPSPIATHNLTFPENSVCYRGKVICPGSPASAPARDQVCGVFSVDLCQMRSLRIFFADDECTNGQMVIASRESQYKILHFHHGGLDKMTEVFNHWKNCIKLHDQALGNDDGTSHYLRKFNIIQSSMRPEDCHPEEGIYSELSEDLWWNYINDRGQIEDVFRLRKAPWIGCKSIIQSSLRPGDCYPEEGIYSELSEDLWRNYINDRGQIEDVFRLRKLVFFGGVDEYLRRDVWPFLLGFFAFDSTTEERNALRGQKRLEYEDIQKERLEMSEEKQKLFYRSVQSTVDKDVVRTDRTHPYFKGDKNPNVDIMRNILLNFAVYQPSMGYSQGMSDLLAPILAELQDESDSFWCFVSLMENVIFVSSPKDEDMEMQLTYLLELIKLMLPEFWDHLIQIDDAMELLFCHRWILLCFKREFSEPEALRMWESCWAHYQTDYFHLFICLAIIAIYGDDVVQQSLPADDMLLHFSNLSMQMNGDIVLKKARSLLHQFRTLVRIPCTLDKLCRTCEPGMWDSGHSPVVECVGIHEAGYSCPHIR